MKKVTKAVIPAAGLGTRFLPATKAQPKEMLPIVDTPTIQYIVEEAIASGITDLLIITGRTKRSVEDHFDKAYELETELEKSGKVELLRELEKISNMINVHYVRQKEAKGLGHAILCAKSFVGDEPFAVLLGDDVVYNDEKPCLKQLIDVYEEKGGSVVGVQNVAPSDVNKYGIVDCKDLGNRLYEVKDLVEKPAVDKAPSTVAILGRYIIEPEIFALLEKTEAGVGGEIQLTDALRKLGQEKTMYAYDFEGRRYDVGTRQGFLEATVEYALRREDTKHEFLKYLQDIIEKY